MTNLEVQYTAETFKEAGEIRCPYMISMYGTIFSAFEDYCAKHNVEFSAGLETAMIEFMSNYQ